MKRLIILSVKVFDVPEAGLFIYDVNRRLKERNIFTNPFKGKIRTYRRKGELLCLLFIEPIYPPFWVAGFFPLTAFIIWRWWWLLIPAFPLFLLGVLWSKPFYFFFIKIGLRKAGYRGSVKWLSLKDAWRWLDGSDRSI